MDSVPFLALLLNTYVITHSPAEKGRLRGRGTRLKGERGRVPDSRIFASVPLMLNLQTDAAFKTSTRCLMPLTIRLIRVWTLLVIRTHEPPPSVQFPFYLHQRRSAASGNFICGRFPGFHNQIGASVDVTADGHVLDSGLAPGNIPFIKCFLSGISWQADLTLDLGKSNWQEWS